MPPIKNEFIFPGDLVYVWIRTGDRRAAHVRAVGTVLEVGTTGYGNSPTDFNVNATVLQPNGKRFDGTIRLSDVITRRES